MQVGEIILLIFPLMCMETIGVGTIGDGVGTILGYGMPDGAGEALDGDGDGIILGDGTAGAGAGTTGAGTLAGVGTLALVGAGTTGAGEATVGAGTTDITIEMLPLIDHGEGMETPL